jgi:lipoprotein NlpD
MYSIGWLYGHDYRDIAQWNNIEPPYVITQGQRLRVAPPRRAKTSTYDAVGNTRKRPAALSKGTSAKADRSDRQATAPQSQKVEIAKASTTVAPAASNSNVTTAPLVWRWPVLGANVVETYDVKDPGRKGLDLAGRMGQPIYSAAPGRVVYSGGGLKRYGKLIIIKHDDAFLSAYAHNNKLLVKEGDLLQGGQQIAEMGNTGTNSTKLHFEIRRDGKPVDPLRYLPKLQ